MAREPEFFERWWRTWPASVKGPVEDILAGIKASRRRLFLPDMRPKEILAIKVRFARDMARRRADVFDDLYEERVFAGESTLVERRLIKECARNWESAVHTLDEIWRCLARDHDSPVRHALDAALEHGRFHPEADGFRQGAEPEIPAWLETKPPGATPALRRAPIERTPRYMDSKRGEPTPFRARRRWVLFSVILAAPTLYAIAQLFQWSGQ